MGSSIARRASRAAKRSTDERAIGGILHQNLECGGRIQKGPALPSWGRHLAAGGCGGTGGLGGFRYRCGKRRPPRRNASYFNEAA